MRDFVRPYRRASFFSRTVFPTGIVLMVMAASWFAYNAAGRVDQGTLHGLLSNASAVALFAAIGFGALFVYPLAFLRGAGPIERISACLIIPLCWAVKEVVRVSDFFTFWESLYYGLNSVILLALTGTVGLMGVCELICRGVVRKRRLQPQRVITPGPVAAILLSLAAVYILVVWGGGVHWFYIYMEGYKALFHTNYPFQPYAEMGNLCVQAVLPFVVS